MIRQTHYGHLSPKKDVQVHLKSYLLIGSSIFPRSKCFQEIKSFLTTDAHYYKYVSFVLYIPFQFRHFMRQWTWHAPAQYPATRDFCNTRNHPETHLKIKYTDKPRSHRFGICSQHDSHIIELYAKFSNDFTAKHNVQATQEIALHLS